MKIQWNELFSYYFFCNFLTFAKWTKNDKYKNSREKIIFSAFVVVQFFQFIYLFFFFFRKKANQLKCHASYKKVKQTTSVIFSYPATTPPINIWPQVILVCMFSKKKKLHKEFLPIMPYCKVVKTFRTVMN